jgi:O-antigen/teichoic acid export membrane protein
VKKLFNSPQVLSLGGNVLASLAGFLSIWILARILSFDALGKWMIFLTAFTFADMLRSGIIHSAFIRLASSGKNVSIYGSAWIVGLSITFLLSSVIYIISCAFPGFITNAQLYEFVVYFPSLFIVSLPLNLALWFRQAANQFNHILYLRLLLALPFLLFVSSGFFIAFDLIGLIQVYILCYLFASGTAVLLNWTFVSSIFQANFSTLKSLLGFGKYSMGTLICSNLLKSSDAFMINWYLGPTAVALYNLPYKLIELVEIPLRSFVATALPQLARYGVENNKIGIQTVFNKHVGSLTLSLIPFAIGCLLFSSSILMVVGGESYVVSANIFRCFVFYSLFLPLDRFIGVTLDSLNKPHLNLIKVLVMLVVNISTNLLVLEKFESSTAVASTTILTIISGVMLGMFLLRKTIRITINSIANEGFYLLQKKFSKQFLLKV